jgi:hypothetical protein
LAFCQNCGARLNAVAAVAQVPDGTSSTEDRLPGALAGRVRCKACGTHNALAMNFCQQCGQSLAEATPVPGSPAAPQSAASPDPAAGVGSAALGRRRVCPACAGQTPVGFPFCQVCGKPLAPEERAQPTHGAAEVSGEFEGRASRIAAPIGATLPPSEPSQTPAALGRAETPLASRAEAPPISTANVSPGHTLAPSEQPWGLLRAVLRDGSDGEGYPLVGTFVEVGRGSADISFDDVYLAHRHCRFETSPQGPRVVPVDTVNGVLYRIDGATEIEHGALLLLGREVLRFEICDAAEREAPALVRHGVTLFGSPPRRPWGRLIQLLGSGGVLDVRHLLGDEVIVGREEGDVLYPDDEFLSRRHALFRRREDGCEVEDLRSSNGTFLRLTGPRLLDSGDHLRLGDQMFRFELPGS